MTTLQELARVSGLAIAVASLWPAAASAQANPAAEPQDSTPAQAAAQAGPPAAADGAVAAAPDASPANGDIVVTGLRRSLQTAQALKRNSDQIVDAVVAEDIGKLPDNNASEALARITGVQVNRSSDEAGGVQVRGLPNLTTTFNSREMFTAELRNVALQDFPAGALAGLEVYKTTSADQIEGGIAGLINVRSRRPFDFDGFQIAGAVRGTYGDQAKTYDPNFNVLVTDRWDTAIGELGALVNVSYTQLHYLTSSRYINGNIVSPGQNQPVDGDRNFVLPESAGVYYDRGKRWRPSVNGTLQWRPADNLEFYIDGLFQGARTDVANDFAGLNLVSDNPRLSNIVRNAAEPGTLESVTVTPDFANGRGIDFSRSTRAGRTNAFQGAIGGSWKGERATISTDFAYTDSKAEYTDYNLDFAPGSAQSADVVFDIGGKDGGAAFGLPGFNANDPNNYILRGIYDRRSLATGKGIQWRIDLKLQTELPVINQIDVGFRLTDRDARLQSGGRYATLRPLNLRLTDIPGGDSGEPIDAGFRGGQAPPLSQWYAPTRDGIVGNIEALRDLARRGLAQIGTPAAQAELALWASDIPAYVRNERLDALERSYAFYGQFHYGFDVGSTPVDGVIGVRLVNTAAKLTGNALVGGDVVTSTSRQNYVDVLPSASFRAKFTDQLQLRLSATETRTRPEYNQLNPAITIGNPNGTPPITGNSGNINLQPILSKNYDASLEWYFSKTGSLTGAIFRRDVQGFITNLNVPTDVPPYGQIVVNRPENGGKGRLQGAEVAFQTFFDFLPGWLSGFGTQLNATYIDASQALPLSLGATGQDSDIPGVSKWSYNAVGIYEKGPVSARLAYNWRSRVTNFFATDNAGQLIGAEFNRPIERLDFSLSVAAIEAVTLTFDVSNITGSPYRALRAVPGLANASYPRDVRYESRVFALGARFRF
ncbi:TonB-dependent receptor [Sphingomonas gellani]|uniref:TonB-dependent receptor n=1 Tax=Sphingomonas gellani TaxID=1166340 RepID=A0A1H8DWK3_9SPHN|nr:TonB-dependent receptor [Sphingomonas gellani]SEN11546.1 TonB-dependent receptor [Sphingomonas gellani]